MGALVTEFGVSSFCLESTQGDRWRTGQAKPLCLLLPQPPGHRRLVWEHAPQRVILHLEGLQVLFLEGGLLSRTQPRIWIFGKLHLPL